MSQRNQGKSPYSQQASERVNRLMNYLDEAEQSSMSSIDFEQPSNYLSIYDDAKTKMLNMTLELDEANKTIESLKSVVNRQKQHLDNKESEHKSNLDDVLREKAEEYQTSLESNLEFVNSLLEEKKQLHENMAKVAKTAKENDDKFTKAIQDLKQKHEREMKKCKDAWNTSEKLRRDNWIKEKTKEIKDMTIRGIEPEMTRMPAEHQAQVKRLNENHEDKVKMMENDAKV